MVKLFSVLSPFLWHAVLLRFVFSAIRSENVSEFCLGGVCSIHVFLLAAGRER